MPPTASAETADRLQGPIGVDPRFHGDFVVRRRDGLFTYQLAVVVDDAWQGVTDVVRGADLLDSTPWQAELAHCLDYRPFNYAHLPIVVEPDGAKLAKSRRSLPIDASGAGSWLARALVTLGQPVSPEMPRLAPGEILRRAAASWNALAIRGFRQVRAPE